ncbi:LOW QUALITY PROTEIN: zinc finger protein NANOS-O [Aphomia sociella]
MATSTENIWLLHPHLSASKHWYSLCCVPVLRFSSWRGQEDWQASNSHLQNSDPLKQRSASFLDLVMKQCTLEDALEEFRLNGSDSPYNPDEEKVWSQQNGNLIGMGPSSLYLRQKSWPEPERTPSVSLPRPQPSRADSEWLPAADFQPTATSPVPSLNNDLTSYTKEDAITEEQLRVLASLPNNILYTLLRELEQGRGEKRSKRRVPDQECRFCKNNGERASYYRSHPLRDAGGRVACPVLRAFVCPRCGGGARAHTAKYCPLSTNEERMKSAAMMRSVRMASGRRRVVTSSATDSASSLQMSPQDSYDAPLDPLWAALEQKLML